MLKALITQSTKIKQIPSVDFAYSRARANALLELSKVLLKNMDKSCFVNSGAEATDTAIEPARKSPAEIRSYPRQIYCMAAFLIRQRFLLKKRIVFVICLLQTIHFC